MHQDGSSWNLIKIQIHRNHLAMEDPALLHSIQLCTNPVQLYRNTPM